MNLFKVITTAVAMSASFALAQDAPYTPNPDWEAPENLHQNRETARAFFVPYASNEEAFKGHRDDSSFVIPLNGDWKFHWSPQPSARPLDFAKPSFDVSKWDTIDVPSNWQMRGYGIPVYSNQRYTIVRNWPYVMTPPRNADEKNYSTPKAEPNAVGSYRRDIDIPTDWDGREVFIQFDGVDSFFYLFVNGEKVGFSKDSRTAAIFNISPYLKPGKNVIAAEVYRYSDGTYLECQDMWRLSGIFRDVFLYSTPKLQVRDFFVHTNFPQKADGMSDYSSSQLKVDVDLRNLAKISTDYKISAKLYNAAKQEVASLSPAAGSLEPGKESQVSLKADIKNPALWSAEKPNLYRLIISLENKAGESTEIVSKHIGFRDIKLLNGRFLVNGMPVKLKGVNRHESSHANGHSVTEAECREEILLMKRGNINHIRNSHYPQPAYFYDLCDEYGIYVCDEANIESHGYYYGKESLSHPKEWEAQTLWRNINMVEQSKNHPSIVIWSYGNEAGPGKNFEVVQDWVKQRDPSRLTQYERNNSLADLRSNQYPSVDWSRDTAAKKLDKPWYVSEYAHILCNSMGNLQDYWDAFDSSDSIIGGGIWEWIYQSYDQEVTLPDGSKVKRQAYGGNYGDYPNDGIFCIKGVIYSDRSPSPVYAEVRKAQQNVAFSISKNSGKNGVELSIKNKHLFTNLDEYDISWTLSQDGSKIISSGTIAAAAAPLQSVTVNIPASELLKSPLAAGYDYFLSVNAKLKSDTNWAKKGHVIATEQFELNNLKIAATAPAISGDKLSVGLQANALCIKGKNFSVNIDKATAGLSNYKVGEQELIGSTPSLLINAFRAPLANDQWIMNTWLQSGLRQLEHSASPLQVEELPSGAVRVRSMVRSQGTHKERLDHYVSGDGQLVETGELAEGDFHFNTQLIYTILPDGSINIQSKIVSNNSGLILPKLGFALQLPKQYNRTTWYGRGEGENYPDRKASAPMGIFERSVNAMVEKYPKPMEMGNRMDTRWVALTNESGAGLLVAAAAGDEFNFSALPFSADTILRASHPQDLTPSDSTHLSIDALTLGLGGASCGPVPMARDIPRAVPIKFSISLRPLAAGADKAAIGSRALPAQAQGKLWELSSNEQQKESISIEFVSSELPNTGAGENMIDGKVESYWHSMKGVTLASYPHDVRLKLGKPRTIAGLSYQAADISDAQIKDYAIYISQDGENWGEPIHKGNLTAGAGKQQILLTTPVKANYLRLVGLSSQTGGDSASISELQIIEEEEQK